MRFLLTVLSYSFITIFVAVPWHMHIFKNLYDHFGIYNKDPFNFPLGIFSVLIQGAILAILYPYYEKGKSGVASGLKFGLMMGTFLFSVSTLANAAKIEVASLGSWIAIQTAFHALQFSLAGSAIGFIHKNMKVS